MSIYNNLPQRSQETQYSLVACQLLQICQQNLLSFLKNGKSHIEPIDFMNLSEQFSNNFIKLREIESQKTVEFKFSYYCQDLAKFFNCQDKSYLPKIEESKSSKNFDIFLMNDAVSFENSRIEPAQNFNSFVFNRSKSSNKSRINTKKTNSYVLNRYRPVSSKSGVQVSSNSSRKTIVNRSRDKMLPSKYYHDKALEMIFESIDKSYD